MFYYQEKMVDRVLTLVWDHSLKEVHKVKKRYSIFRIEVPDPYPHLNGGQIRRASGLSIPTVT